MTKPIVQSVTFKASPAKLFQIYTDSKKHSAATGAKASVNAKVGARFTAFDGMLEGKNLVVVPGRMIVQAWRAAHWKKSDLDSILTLTFSKAPGGGRVDLVHVGVLQHDHQGVTQGLAQILLEAVASLPAATALGCGPLPPSCPRDPARGSSLFLSCIALPVVVYLDPYHDGKSAWPLSG